MTHPKKGRVSSKAKDPSAAAEAKRIASANYYRQNADMIRAKRRIQMAEKRARIKANRRKSDKSRPKKNTSRTTDSNCRCLAEAEKETTEVLASLSRSRPRISIEEFAVQSDDGIRNNYTDDEDSDEPEEAMGTRTISEVAGDPLGPESDSEVDWQLSPITRQEQPSQASDVPVAFSESSASFRTRRRYWTPPVEDDPIPEPQPRLSSFIDHMEAYMDRRYGNC
ncbi:hypothetical protein R3P38DRAFT_896010 [Favolaschia claudopus]|uniref:Uncharacterized protein n=1 Tax=Favolaschia claudopus TaxID=2862362 RepID=A0AAW0BVU6_9AGAR